MEVYTVPSNQVTTDLWMENVPVSKVHADWMRQRPSCLTIIVVWLIRRRSWELFEGSRETQESGFWFESLLE